MSHLLTETGTLGPSDNEPFCDTLRKFFAMASPPPDDDLLFVSEGGINRGAHEAMKNMRPNDFEILKKEAAVWVKFYDGDRTITHSTKQFIYGYQVVYIDVIGNASQTTHDPDMPEKNIYGQMQQIKDRIDDILLRSQNTPINQSRVDRPSAIIGFENIGIDWIRTGEVREAGITDQFSGEIRCHFQRNC